MRLSGGELSSTIVVFLPFNIIFGSFVEIK